MVEAAALVGSIATVFVALTTLVPGAPLLPEWAFIPVFVGVFPVHFRSVRVLIADPRAGAPGRMIGALRPRGLRLLVVVLFAGAAFLAATSLITLRGQPERHGDQYYLRNHTDLIPVSRAEYFDAIALEQRGFVSIAFVFYLAALVINADIDTNLPTPRTNPIKPSRLHDVT
jgi:hypothetical protein